MGVARKQDRDQDTEGPKGAAPHEEASAKSFADASTTTGYVQPRAEIATTPSAKRRPGDPGVERWV